MLKTFSECENTKKIVDLRWKNWFLNSHTNIVCHASLYIKVAILKERVKQLLAARGLLFLRTVPDDG
jgi:hypothetical protein